MPTPQNLGLYTFSYIQGRPGSKLRWFNVCLNIIWASMLTKSTLNSICKMNIQNPKCKKIHTKYANWICKIQNAKNFTDMFSWRLAKIVFSISSAIACFLYVIFWMSVLFNMPDTVETVCWALPTSLLAYECLQTLWSLNTQVYM